MALDIAAPNLANVKSGSKKLSPQQVEKLAALIDAEPGELWELQEMEHMRRKNPFRTGFAAIGAIFSAFLAAVLLAGGIGLSSSQQREKSTKKAVDVLHIVAITRQMTMLVVWLLKSLRTAPMVCRC